MDVTMASLTLTAMTCRIMFGLQWHILTSLHQKLLQRQGSCEASPTPAAFNSLVREPDRDGRDVIHSVIVRT